MTAPGALVLLSGGQDSSTCLAWALDRFPRVETVGFDYKQRHNVELVCRKEILRRLPALRPEWEGRLGEDYLLDLAVLGEISESALTRDVEIAVAEAGLPNTFVPGRNVIFLTFAAALAYRRNLGHIVGGMCQADYSGYPDCRDDAVKALQVSLNLGMGRSFVLETPLMWRDKAEAWDLVRRLGGEPLVELILEHSHTCYRGLREQRHEWGYGCGSCPACELRVKGYREFRDRFS